MESAVLEQAVAVSKRQVAATNRRRGINLDADDVGQEVAIKFLVADLGSANVAADACRCANWVSATMRRSYARRNRIAPTVALGDVDPCQYDVTVLERIVESEDFGALRDAIASLPADMQQVIELRFYAGKSFREIAVATGLSELSIGAVSAKIQKALVMLRGLMS